MQTTSKSQIEQIISKKSIMEYLENRGHQPVNCIGNGRYRFLCPFSDHKESNPSFVVFTQSEYENFYCFGCGKGGTIIQLISHLDGISFRQTLEKLSDGITVSAEEDIKFLIERIKNSSLTSQEIAFDFSKTLLEISWQCLCFLQGVDFNENETHIIDGYYEFIDEQLLSAQLEKIEQSVQFLPTVLSQRKNYFEQKLESDRKKEFEEEIKKS